MLISTNPKVFMRKKRGKYTGELINQAKREVILSMLTLGDPLNAISQATGVSRPTIRAIRTAEYPNISHRQSLLGAMWQRVAIEGCEQLSDEVSAGKFKGVALATVAGIATDKSVACRGLPTLHVEHTHSHQHRHFADFNALLSKLPSRASHASLPDKGSGNNTLDKLAQASRADHPEGDKHHDVIDINSDLITQEETCPQVKLLEAKITPASDSTPKKGTSAENPVESVELP